MERSVVCNYLQMSHCKSSVSPAIPVGKSSPTSLSRPLTNTQRSVRPGTTKSAATTGPVLPKPLVYAKRLCPRHRIRQWREDIYKIHQYTRYTVKVGLHIYRQHTNINSHTHPRLLTASLKPRSATVAE